MMEQYTKAELEEALRAVTSMISKCEKARDKQSLGLSQQTLLRNRIKALEISSDLIKTAITEAAI